MDQVSVLCQNDNCFDQIIKRVCQQKSCNKNRLICDRCLIDHKTHIQDCFLICDIPQQLNVIQKQKKDAYTDTETAIEGFLKKVRKQIEQKFAFQHCPIFQIQLSQNILDWTSKDFYQFSQSLSQLDFQSNYFDKALSEKIKQLNSMQFDGKSFEQLFVPNQSQARNKIITQGLSAKINKNYGMNNFQPQILRENVFNTIEIRDYELISGTDIEKLAILTPNLLDLAKDQIKLTFKYEGDILYKDGKSKFGLYTGILNKCSLSEEGNEENLILINDQGCYVQKDKQLIEQEEVDLLFPDNDNNQFMLVFNKQLDNLSLSLINLRSNKKAEIQIKSYLLYAYFCFSLSCLAKVHIL
ncbi:unnamed protein product [Paramecium octaurelia]|uniref:Uncharacterized protein n=1 Tax=Paramecium octaurelia TaxID=43137 RepID=A0A8S1SBY8_PAROT|nr:unnamed protein product [Paramecium octaurelia]